MKFIFKIKNSFTKFMLGRYGADNLYRFLCIVYFITVWLYVITRSIIMAIISTVVLAILLYRFFSRNLYKRSEENRKYLAVKKSITDFFALGRDRFRDRKTHVYRRCPNCRAMLRLPKRKGKHTVRCPKCNESFEVKV